MDTYVDDDGKTIENCGQLPKFGEEYLNYGKAVYPGMLVGDCASQNYTNPIGTGQLEVQLRGRIDMDIFNKSAWIPPNKT